MVLSEVLLDAKRPAEALEYALAAVRLDSEAAQAHAALANAYLTAGNAEESLMAFERAIDLAPDCLEFHAGEGAALSTLGRHQEAVVAFEKFFSKDVTAFRDRSRETWEQLYETSKQRIARSSKRAE
jgi:tetratricopeptide (TPR) repeat protein